MGSVRRAGGARTARGRGGRGGTAGGAAAGAAAGRTPGAAGAAGGRGGAGPPARAAPRAALPARATLSLFVGVLFLFAPSRAVPVLFLALFPWKMNILD